MNWGRVALAEQACKRLAKRPLFRIYARLRKPDRGAALEPDAAGAAREIPGSRWFRVTAFDYGVNNDEFEQSGLSRNLLSLSSLAGAPGTTRTCDLLVRRQ